MCHAIYERYNLLIHAAISIWGREVKAAYVCKDRQKRAQKGQFVPPILSSQGDAQKALKNSNELPQSARSKRKIREGMERGDAGSKTTSQPLPIPLLRLTKKDNFHKSIFRLTKDRFLVFIASWALVCLASSDSG